jgi:hypothetical protein
MIGKIVRHLDTHHGRSDIGIVIKSLPYDFFQVYWFYKTIESDDDITRHSRYVVELMDKYYQDWALQRSDPVVE